MRRFIAVLCASVALPLAADWKSPIWYIQKLAASKNVYNVESKPASNPIDEYTCSTPVGSVARIRSGDRWTLGIPKLHPDSMKLVAEGEELFEKKQYAEAAVRYRKAIALDANNAIAHLLYGDALFLGDGDYAAALAEYRNALAIDATNPSAHFFSANALMRLDRPDEARAAVVSALSYNPVYQNLYQALSAPDAFGLRPLARHRFDPPRGYLGKPDGKETGFFDGYVAFEIVGQRCPVAAPMYPEPLHREVEKYVARYVVVKK